MERIAILGGTGPHGRGLGSRLARAGHHVILGSRDAARAAEAAAEVTDITSSIAPAARGLAGATNQHAVDDADIVIVAVPYDGQAATLAGLSITDGTLVISCVNPLEFDKQGPVPVAVAEGSAAEQAAALLPGATVVAAFHHLSAPKLITDYAFDDEAVLVVGDDPGAKQRVCALAGSVVGHEGIDAGPLRNARQLEELTAVLISINQRYKSRAGLAITGLAR